DPLGTDELPWEQLERADGVYFTAGDGEALRRARAARVLVASPRARTALSQPGPRLDALVYSGNDQAEQEWAESIGDRAAIIVSTEGAAGGSWRTAGGETGRWAPLEPPGEVRDSYGCGDSFAAGLTFALAGGAAPEEAVAFGAQCGARCLTRTGAP